MKRRKFHPLFFLPVIAILFFSCNKTETLQTALLSDYLPLLSGKYITYRIDSTVFTNFGRSTEIHSYQVKHVVDSMITDNLGRPSYRVFRFIRDASGTQSWQPSGTFYLTPLTNSIELIEDNLRVIKLYAPVVDAFTWKGNKYMPTNPYGSLYNFSNDDDIQSWDFHYSGNPSIFSYGGINYTNVQTVEEVADSINVPINVPTAYASMNRSVEKYSKSTGLIYREYTLWEYQPNTGGVGGPYKTGFGIREWMIDHN
jgi:hypothetical protein